MTQPVRRSLTRAGLYREYVTRRRSARRIAADTGWSEPHVRDGLHQFGIAQHEVVVALPAGRAVLLEDLDLSGGRSTLVASPSSTFVFCCRRSTYVGRGRSRRGGGGEQAGGDLVEARRKKVMVGAIDHCDVDR